MFRIAALLCFAVGFILEVIPAKLGPLTPLAFGLAGLAFLALVGVNFGTLVRRR